MAQECPVQSRRLGRHAQLLSASANAPSLRAGARGEGVAELQGVLADLGFSLPITFRSGQADGAYGAETETAVRDFQQRNGLVADGIAGRATITALDELIVANPMLDTADLAAERLQLAKTMGLPLANKPSAYW
jgi:peptidoglycan hydrolase-like protein with peptidoglycan-binding domain